MEEQICAKSHGVKYLIKRLIFRVWNETRAPQKDGTAFFVQVLVLILGSCFNATRWIVWLSLERLCGTESRRSCLGIPIAQKCDTVVLWSLCGKRLNTENTLNFCAANACLLYTRICMKLVNQGPIQPFQPNIGQFRHMLAKSVGAITGIKGFTFPSKHVIMK